MLLITMLMLDYSEMTELGESTPSNGNVCGDGRS